MNKRFLHKLYGLIGNPVAHSLSPNMHNAAFGRLKIDAVYLPILVKKTRLKEAIFSLKETGVSGFNVTIPFKSECMQYLDKISPLAEMIGAVNTVSVKGESLIGSNTDYAGFLRSLREDLQFIPRNKNIFILGAGGGAKAVAFALASRGCSKISIYDLIGSRANDLASAIKKNFPKLKTKASMLKEMPDSVKDCELLVNCTPLGMKKKDPLPIDVKLLHKGLKVYDIIYTPLKTELIRAAEKRSIRATGGIGMLLYQGVLAFELWTKRKAPISLMKKELFDSLR
jgi:shikimate dehydrogenase